RARPRRANPPRVPGYRTCRRPASTRPRARASFVPLARARDAVLVESIDQRAARDAELLGGARLVAGALVERLDDALLLELGDGRTHLARHVGAGDRSRRRRGRVAK